MQLKLIIQVICSCICAQTKRNAYSVKFVVVDGIACNELHIGQYNFEWTEKKNHRKSLDGLEKKTKSMIVV